MTNTINAEAIQGVDLPESLPFVTDPWTSFYQASEIIRELHGPPKPSAPDRPEDAPCDEAASSRMDDDGCPPRRTNARPGPHRYSGMGGRLLLVGSPVF